MEKQVGHKFACVIKDCSSLKRKRWDSVPVQIGDCKWRLSAYPIGINSDHLCLRLEVVDFKSLPSGWRRYVKFRLTIVKQFSEESSVLKDAHRWFDQNSSSWVFLSMIPLTKLNDKKEGFLVNGEIMIVAEVDILQVIGTFGESEETTPLKKLKVESVSSSSERQKETVVEFREKNQHLKTACMNVLLSLTQTLCQAPHELSIDDLLEAGKTLAYMKDMGFEVDWLEKKVEEVKEQSC